MTTSPTPSLASPFGMQSESATLNVQKSGGRARGRVAAIVLATIVALAAAPALLRAVVGSATTGPNGSSYATTPEGLAAFAELARAFGHRPIPVRVPLAQWLPQQEATVSTVVVLDATPTADDLEALDRFVRSGGTAIVGGSGSGWISEQLGGIDTVTTRRTETAIVKENVGGAKTLRIDTVRRFRVDPTLTVLAAAPNGDAVVVSESVGSGRYHMLADSSFVSNRLLDERDNAAFALALVGDANRRLMFAEDIHGYRDTALPSGVPWRLRWFLLLLLPAAVLWVLAGRRNGPPEERDRRLPPARVEFTDALASALTRASDHTNSKETIGDPSLPPFPSKGTP